MSPYLCASEGYDERDVARQCASGQGLGGAVLSVEQEDCRAGESTRAIRSFSCDSAWSVGMGSRFRGAVRSESR